MTNSSPFGKKIAAAALAALTLGAGLTMNTGEAEARGGRKGAWIAAGVVGALATAAIVASSHNARADHGGYYAHPGYEPEDAYVPTPVYTQPVQYHPGYANPGYVQPGYGYQGHPGYRRHHRQRYAGYSETGFAYRGPVCKIKKQRFFDGYGWRVQKVQVCR